MRIQISTLLLSLSILMQSSRCFSQIVTQSSRTFDYQPLYVESETDGITSFGKLDYLLSYSNAIVYLNGGEAVIPVEDANEKKVHLLKIDSTTKVLWDILTGQFSGVAKFNQNIIVFSKILEGKSVRGLKATLYNSVDGKKMAEKTVFENKENVFVDDRIITDAQKNFHHLLIRFTNSERENYGYSNKELEKETKTKTATQKIEVLSFDDQLNVVATRQIQTDLPTAKFFSCAGNDKGDIFLAGYTETTFFAEKIEKTSSQAVSKIKIPIASSPVRAMTGKIFVNEVSGDIVIATEILTQDKEKAYENYRFDFASNKGAKAIMAFDKQLMKSVEQKNARDLNILGIGQYNNYTIALHEATGIETISSANLGMQSSSIREYGLNIIVSVYNDKMDLVKRLFVKRKSEAIYPNIVGITPGYKFLNDKLYLSFTEIEKIAKYADRWVEINLSKLEAGEKATLNLSGFNKRSYIEGRAAVWFNNSVLVPYLEQQNLIGTPQYKMMFQKISF